VGFVLVIFMAENTGSHGLCSPASPYLHSYRQARWLHQTGAWNYHLCGEMSPKHLPACIFILSTCRYISPSYPWV